MLHRQTGFSMPQTLSTAVRKWFFERRQLQQSLLQCVLAMGGMYYMAPCAHDAQAPNATASPNILIWSVYGDDVPC